MIRSCYQFSLYKQSFKLVIMGQQDKWVGVILILSQVLAHVQSYRNSPVINLSTTKSIAFDSIVWINWKFMKKSGLWNRFCYRGVWGFFFLPLTFGNISPFLVCVYVLVAQLCPTLCDPMACSPPSSSLHGILQSRILEWVANSFSRGSSWPRVQTQVCQLAVRLFTIWATRKAHLLSLLCSTNQVKYQKGRLQRIFRRLILSSS